MADEKIDRDGNVYQRGWDGQYRPKQGVLGQVQDKNFFGEANVARGMFGNPKEAKGWFGSDIQTNDGRPLYEMRNISERGGSGSSTGGGSIFWIVLIVLGFAFIAIYLILKFIFLSTKKGLQAVSQGAIGKALFHFLPLGLLAVLGLVGGLYVKNPSAFGVKGALDTPPLSEPVVFFNSPSPAPTSKAAAETASPLAAAGAAAATPAPQPTPAPSASATPPPAELSPTVVSTQQTGRLIVSVEAVNLRAGPGVSFNVIGYAYQGDPFRFYGMDDQGKWYQLDPAGSTWIAASAVAILPEESAPAVTPQTLGVVVVIENSVYLRAGPAKTFSVVGYAYRGDQLPVFGRNADDTWFQVDETGQTWIAALVVTYDGNIAALPILPTAMNPQTP